MALKVRYSPHVVHLNTVFRGVKFFTCLVRLIIQMKITFSPRMIRETYDCYGGYSSLKSLQQSTRFTEIITRHITASPARF